MVPRESLGRSDAHRCSRQRACHMPLRLTVLVHGSSCRTRRSWTRSSEKLGSYAWWSAPRQTKARASLGSDGPERQLWLQDSLGVRTRMDAHHAIGPPRKLRIQHWCILQDRIQHRGCARTDLLQGLCCNCHAMYVTDCGLAKHKEADSAIGTAGMSQHKHALDMQTT